MLIDRGLHVHVLDLTSGQRVLDTAVRPQAGPGVEKGRIDLTTFEVNGMVEMFDDFVWSSGLKGR